MGIYQDHIVCGFDELDRLTELLCLLESELRESQVAASQLDVDAVERHTRCTDAICREIGSAIRGIPENRRITPDSQGNADEDRFSGVIARVAETASTYGQLLAKSRRTIDVLMNVLATSAVAYLPPKTSSRLELGF